MADYGTDLSCTTDLDPLGRLVSGDELMVQVCVRRLYCASGALLSDPTDNSIDVRDLISADIGPNDIVRIQGLCSQALLGDPRILSANVIATFSAGTLTLRITAYGANGPFSLTLAVTALTVTLLTPT